MSKTNKLYVGNLSYDVKKDDLVELFSKFGDVVDAVVISDKYSGRSKGFGFVELDSVESAEKAITELNEQEFEGRQLRIDYAKPKA